MYSFNYTLSIHLSWTGKDRLKSGYCLSVIGFLALFSNLLLSLVLIRNRQMLQRAYNLIISTLGIVDCLTGAIMIGMGWVYLFEQKQFLLLKIAWQCITTLSKISVLLVLCLAIERWFAVVRPIQYRYQFKKSRVFIYLAVITATASSLNIPSSMLHHTTKTYFELAEGILMVLLPMIFTWAIFFQIWIHSKKSPATRKTAGGKLRSSLLRMCATTAALLTITWLPLEILQIVRKLFEIKDSALKIPFYMLAMSNSFVNPWVYYFTNKEYKREFDKLLPCSAVQCKLKTVLSA